MSTSQKLLPISAGTVVIEDEHGALLGSGYVEPSAPGCTPIQRWILRPGYLGPPEQRLFIHASKRQYASLGEWVTDLSVGNTWAPGSLYVQAKPNSLEQIFGTELAIILQGKEVVGFVELMQAVNVRALTSSTVETNRVKMLCTTELWTTFDGYKAPPVGSIEIRAPRTSDPTLETLRARRNAEHCTRSVGVECYTFASVPDSP